MKTDLTRGDLVAVKFACHQVSSSRVLDREVFAKVLGNVSLPKGLDAMLRQQVLDREVLRPFGAIEKSLRDFMFQRSVKTELGDIIDPALVPEVSAKLEEAKQKYEEAIPTLLSSYSDACAKQDARIKAEFPNAPWLPALLGAVAEARPSEDDLIEGVSMEYFLFHVGQLNDGFDEEAEKRVQSGVVSLRKDLPGRAVKEVAKYYAFLKADLDQRETNRIRQSTVEVALRGANKLAAVAFLDPAIGKIAGQVEAAFKQYVRADSLTGVDFDAFQALVGRLASQRHLVRCLELGTDPTSAPASTSQQKLSLPQKQPVAQPMPVMGSVPAAAPAPVVSPVPVTPVPMAQPAVVRPVVRPMPVAPSGDQSSGWLFG